MITNEVTTAELALWYGISRQAIIKRLRKAGYRPIARGRHGVAIWNRRSALAVFRDTPGHTRLANYTRVVYAETDVQSAPKNAP